MDEKELEVLKLITISAMAYAEWKNIITSKMSNNKELAKLFLELPMVQGTMNDIALSRLLDSKINVNSLKDINELLKIMQLD